MSNTALLDKELQEQIDSLFEKSFSELRIKTSKIVSKHYGKILKDLEKKNKTSAPKQPPVASTKNIPVSKKRVVNKTSETSDEDSDYYSE